MHWLLRSWRSSVGRKAIAAASGLVIWAWVVAHMLGNLLVFVGQPATDGYAASLRNTGPLLWAARVGLFVAAVAHVSAVASLARQARSARRQSHVAARPRGSTLASRSIRWGGVALLVFVVLHLLHLTFGVIHPDFVSGRVYRNVVVGLSSPAVAALYCGAVAVLGLHLFHGLWSARRSLGLADRRARVLARPVVATIAMALVLAFAAVPLAVSAGVVR